jgi:hypothetical protein
LWKETVFKVVFSCAVGLELQFVGGPSYFLLTSNILVRITAGPTSSGIMGTYMGYGIPSREM